MIRISHREFVRLVRRAYLQLPPAIRQTLRNVDVTVEEWPGLEELEKLSGGGTLLGLYTGVPLAEREGGPEGPGLPDIIVIYRQPILRGCSSRAEAEGEIRKTLWHEVGHYLGMTEEDLHRLGYG